MTVLFWRFSTDPAKQAASQAALMLFYFSLTGKKLTVKEIPDKPEKLSDWGEEELDETAKFMSQPPRPGPRRSE